MRAPAPAAFLLVLAPHAALAASPCQITSDDCLQRVFLSASNCGTINSTYTNATLADAGYLCCWAQGPFAPPPAQAVSAWLTFDDNNEVSGRCLTQGACVEYYKLPEYETCSSA